MAARADLLTVEALMVCTAVAATFRWRGPAGIAPLTRHVPNPFPRRRFGTRDVVNRVDQVARHLRLASPCLVRSTSSQIMLARRGIPVDLRIGVRVGPAGFEAHAWIERHGVVLNDSPENCATYSAFVEPVELHGAERPRPRPAVFR